MWLGILDGYRLLFVCFRSGSILDIRLFLAFEHSGYEGVSKFW